MLLHQDLYSSQAITVVLLAVPRKICQGDAGALVQGVHCALCKDTAFHMPCNLQVMVGVPAGQEDRARQLRDEIRTLLIRVNAAIEAK